MGRFMNRMREAAKKGDMILLALCVIASLFGIVLIAGTTTNATVSENTSRYILIQSGCLIAGIFIYLLLTTFDIDILASQRAILFAFNTIFILMLLVWGVQGESGNRSWLHFPFLPFNIQPAEVVKLTYILILAKSMSLHQTRISSPRNVVPLTLQMIYIVVLIVGISSDTGVALIFIFVFIAMAFVGGVGWYWFAAAIAALLQQRTEVLTDIPEKVNFFDELPEYDTELFVHKKSKSDKDSSRDVLEKIVPIFEALPMWDDEHIMGAMVALAEAMEAKNAKVMWPVRIAAAGKAVTPGGAVEICRILGKDETLRRLNTALEKLG